MRRPDVMDIRGICTAAPVIPVIVIDDAAQAVPLAAVLVDAGLPVIEVTLRTPAALAAIERIATHVPGAIVGAGTIRQAGDIADAVAAGAVFGVSPGTPPGLCDAIRASGLPFLPGCATVGEAMALRSAGFGIVKLFPAEVLGGTRFLRAVQSPLPDLAFCPTGGLTAESAPDYLALPNVLCVGGSWMLPDRALLTGDWAVIARLAAQAAALGKTHAARAAPA